MHLHSYPKIRPVGHNELIDFLVPKEHDVVITEKLDGSNLRFMFDNGTIVFGTRNRLMDPELEKSNGWTTILEFIKSRVTSDSIQKYNGCTFFGEAMKKHAVDYNWNTIPRFLGFEVRDSSDRWLTHDKMEHIFTDLNLPVVPVVKRCKIADLDITELQKPIHSHFSDGLAEGIVIKDQVNNARAKIVFSIKREKLKNKYFSPDTMDDENLVQAYADSTRINKIILNLIDEGKPLSMSLMKDLPKMVWNDIVVEEYYDILTSNWKLDIKHVRKLVSNACQKALTQMIKENESE